MLEFVHGEVGGFALNGAVAAAADAAGDFHVVGDIDGVVPVVPFGVQVRGDGHAPDLEGGRHSGLGGVRAHFGGEYLLIGIADVEGCDDFGGCAARPVGRVLARGEVFGGGQDADVRQLVHSEVLGSAGAVGFVAGGAEDAGDGEALGEMLFVVPAVEVVFFVCGDVSPYHKQGAAFFVGGVVGHWGLPPYECVYVSVI